MANYPVDDLWRAPSGCAPHLRAPLESLVNAFPVPWRQIPVTGEIFESLVEAERRLRAYALVAGFDVVRGGGGSAKVPGSQFKCIHHGQKSLNTRGLEDRVEKNSDGEITSRRKRERTAVRQRASHGPANARGLTANEILERRERQEDRQRRQNELSEERRQEAQVMSTSRIDLTSNTSTARPSTPPRPETTPVLKTPSPSPQVTPLSQRLPIRTPERPRPRRSPSPEPSPIEIPASTAPPALAGGRGKRMRTHTVRYNEAKEQGFIRDSQEAHRASGRP
ncbi:uncharacterized protein Z518_04086 [Rhinocladiella mackenziei CBS 650.93]|uniref:Rhinocladiella mackenziei CBS 650.93 unplaced genomic scaffold supercont1.3, whole genome shotgun sequence n=1 Tax=Rhinocladiella mackenziei CBS 650.93 TaxID=1442369 RepID=A0A0D2FVE8_9EURO|nr:uncharacterized protein Z518_04086 [Rhinocladiella mackenziei CBS 650.93]KIX06112.1 hypothetical protein Z518_04086 [Rhinocladiella mackenziei CBS 650.93]